MLDDGSKLLGEVDAQFSREDGFIVDVGLAPRHEVFDVFGGTHFRRALELRRIGVLPEVFVFIGGFHFGARGRGAELGDGAVEEVDLVVEVDDYVFLISRSPALKKFVDTTHRSLPATRSHLPLQVV